LLIEGIPLNRIFERKGVEIPDENKKAVDDSQAYQNLFEVSIAHTYCPSPKSSNLFLDLSISLNDGGDCKSRLRIILHFRINNTFMIFVNKTANVLS